MKSLNKIKDSIRREMLFVKNNQGSEGVPPIKGCTISKARRIEATYLHSLELREEGMHCAE